MKNENAKIGDRVAICGNRGTITEITKGCDGVKYARIHFDEREDVAKFGQYQNKYYKVFEFTIL